MKIVDLKGQTFGRLTISECLGIAKGRRWWQAKCACGKETLVTTSDLRRAQRPTRSCGCLRGQWLREHYKASRPPIIGGHKRCRVCEEWKPVGEYYVNLANSEGIRTECKVCTRAVDARRQQRLRAAA